MTEFAGYQGLAGDRSSEKVYKYRSSSFTNQMAQPMCFHIGDKVRIAGGTYVVTFPDKRIEYDLKDRIGIIKLRHSFSKYQVEVEIDGVKRLITVPETDLILQRIDTPLQDGIEKMLRECPYLTDFSIDETGNFHCKFALVAPRIDPSDLVKRLKELGEAVVKRAQNDWVMPVGMCVVDPVLRGRVVIKKKESKMTKERCIKLLESYRAEREKVAKGRKFERCLRADVVNEALEKAIELLKNG